MFKSIFSYPLEKPYPFRWFTPAVFTGGFIALALASFLSVATQGYETVSVYTSNPNATAGDSIFANWPSFLTVNTKPICAPTPISYGTEFLTNNTAFSYTVRGITHSTDSAQPASLVGSFPYQNNPIQNCTIAAIDIQLENVHRDAIQIARGDWGAALTGHIYCIVDTPTGRANLSLVTVYDLNPANRVPQFVTRPNETRQASLYAGQSLLGWHAANLTEDMQHANKRYPPADQVFKGSLTFGRRAGVTDVTSLDYFSVNHCFFPTFNGTTGGKDAVYYCKDIDSVDALAKSPLERGLMPDIWLSADGAAKMFYWVVMTDLGQMNAGPNPLAERDLMAHFIRIYPEGSKQNRLGARPELLGVSPAVVTTTYLCQVPRLKSTGTLLVAVLVNDIVILAALWRLFVLLVGYFLLKPDMMVCEGCSEREPLLPTPEEKRAVRISTV
ncbi:hypothetical protein QBC34DRAFT_150230 [Podospora aff. communis PSN243]|uniref:Uncharacterized protein n=1 Tax=Podospora aff. communis PSN243 TaxID=3040156 RepID=A0AAV9GE34_9PEZI|nr:hypothetical protein QBC34DRAFT_150230 [Podospora aff. communis PSN243]